VQNESLIVNHALPTTLLFSHVNSAAFPGSSPPHESLLHMHALNPTITGLSQASIIAFFLTATAKDGMARWAAWARYCRCIAGMII
jgi:hypothetical protein